MRDLPPTGRHASCMGRTRGRPLSGALYRGETSLWCVHSHGLPILGIWWLLRSGSAPYSELLCRRIKPGKALCVVVKWLSGPARYLMTDLQ